MDKEVFWYLGKNDAAFDILMNLSVNGREQRTKIVNLLQVSSVG